MSEYKDTVFLPKTNFSMRAGLPKKEPEILKFWKEIDIYSKLRSARKGKELFVLHDGPPYANGNLHIGHALNKILKDIINRSQSMLGKDANYVPGWDCHGLPIEWKIEENYRKKKKDKDEIPIIDFRKECREFADKWMNIQSKEFERLGVCGDWKDPYSTMKFESEAKIMSEIGKFLMNGGLYRGVKPVMWSTVEKTALAEAEIEYHEHRSTTIYVRFPIYKTEIEDLKNSNIIIWTTTPWTIPGNRAVAYKADLKYLLIEVLSTSEDSIAKISDKVIVAEELLDSFIEDTFIEKFNVTSKIEGKELEGTILKHPLNKQGYDFDVPLLEANFVTTEQGTGFVHIAPGHGADDFELGRKHSLPTLETVEDDGYLKETLPLFGGLHVLRDNEKMADILSENECLIGRGTINHSYPHSWRSKAPLIFRTTPQWFISMNENDLRKKSLKSISETNFFPSQGANRLSSMIKNRPDWCISRQRAWGVPIGIFYNKTSLEPLRDQEVLDRVIKSFKEHGADAWYKFDASFYLGEKYKPEDYIKVTDIADVWFDSGSTHTYVLEDRNDLKWPASLYLEGTDQHRGWFHSSLLESCGTRGVAPFESVLTHGFVLDENGRKMSKSLGNVTSPQDVLKEYGADILRLWVIGSDYYDDLRIGKEILVRHADHYRRLRNTLRYLLGALSDFDKIETIGYSEMPEIERWVLNKVYELSKKINKLTQNYQLGDIYREVYDFCNDDLSSFYFDIRKDTLYCSSYDSVERRSYRTVLDILFKCICTWLAPILCFTTEEAWKTQNIDKNESVHLKEYFKPSDLWKDDTLSKKWEIIRNLRLMVTNKIEEKRREGLIGSSLEAVINLKVTTNYFKNLSNLNLSEIFICSKVECKVFNDLKNDEVRVDCGKVSGLKCERCWKISDDVNIDTVLCPRCTDVVNTLK
ncbi:isoleucine--tRNA ligase [Alphaproteobacteria bacterium]|nr:isoleucine--tRNA ligase [Alphaproteobacteria bacterium]